MALNNTFFGLISAKYLMPVHWETSHIANVVFSVAAAVVPMGQQSEHLIRRDHGPIDCASRRG